MDAAVFPRHDRGLLEVAGADRAKWLNNLVTNVVLTLQPGEGNYAFVVNVKGRTQFDLNILVRPERLLLDIDRRWIETAAAFLNRYVVTEDAKIADLTDRTCRFAVIGARAHEIAARLGFGNLTAMAWLQNTEGDLALSHSDAPPDTIAPQPSHADHPNPSVLMFRHDFCGVPGAEFIVFGEQAGSLCELAMATAESFGATPIDPAVADVLRIEAGIPASVQDIDEEVIPPETGQIERGISYHKGCYLGQEVIERMRAHKVLARKLVGVRFDGSEIVGRLSPLFIDGVEVGRAMSGCPSPALGGAPLSLAYVKTAHAKPGVKLTSRTAAGDRAGEIVSLPISAEKAAT